MDADETLPRETIAIHCEIDSSMACRVAERRAPKSRSTQSLDYGQCLLRQLSRADGLGTRSDVIPAVSRSARVRPLLIQNWADVLLILATEALFETRHTRCRGALPQSGASQRNDPPRMLGNNGAAFARRPPGPDQAVDPINAEIHWSGL